MFYERKIGSLKEILDEAATMDADAGLRVLGTYEVKGCFAFITRFGGEYTVMVYERRPGKAQRPGRRLAVEELGDVDELKSLLKKVVPPKVTAFAY